MEKQKVFQVRVVKLSHTRARREIDCEKFSREEKGARNARNLDKLKFEIRPFFSFFSQKILLY